MNSQNESSHVALEVDCRQKKFMARGSPEFVREWFERLWPEFSGEQKAGTAELVSPEEAGRPDNSPERVPARSGSSVPDTFGEFYHLFPTNLTDQDKVLLAGYYVQLTSADNSFTTGAANELLRDQGVRPANPSQSIRRSRDARRLFPVPNGFRVSEMGVRYLDELRTQVPGT
jgi:hypothetical protein